MSNKQKNLLILLSVIVITVFFCALLNRTGSLILLWKEQNLNSITHDSEYGYYAFIQDENISKLRLPFFLKEDQRILVQPPLSVNEDITTSIKKSGAGRYQMLENNDLYFSASDNRPEEHEYSIISPMIIRNRYLLAILVPAIAVSAAVIFLCIKHKDFSLFKTAARLLIGIYFLLLLIPWNKFIFAQAPLGAGPFLIKPIFQRNAASLCLLFVLVTACAFTHSSNRLLQYLAVLVFVTNTVYYFAPEWNYFGRRADSGAYLEQYTSSSIRTPGYPMFIEFVYHLTGAEGLEDLRSNEDPLPDELLHDCRTENSFGLINVVRAQKSVLAIVFLALLFVISRYYSPIWLVLLTQIILCGGFLGVDNSYIMTECLSQAMILLTSSFFIPAVKEKKPAFYLIMCVTAALSILIRPANIFLVIPIAVSAAILVYSGKKIWIPLAGCLLFVLISAIPALTIFQAYKIFVWMPSSGYVDIARAVDYLEPGDENTFSDGELRSFCADLLKKKEIYPDADQNTNMWQIAVATAEEYGYGSITCSPIFQKISRKILSLHFSEFTADLIKTMETALSRTRLRLKSISFLPIAAIFVVLFLLKIKEDSFIGLVFMLMHAAHLCISVVNQPERRYIYSTEILCLMGWFFILLTVIHFGLKKQSGSTNA